MEKRTRRTITTQQPSSLADLPTELMHRIQSLLSEKEAARTCVLSMSWLYAWATIPTLRFPSHGILVTQETRNNELVFHTVQRYHNHHVPIETLAFEFHPRHWVYNEFWFRHVLSSQTRSCLKELSLDIWNLTDIMFTFSDDVLFSGEKLQTIKLNAMNRYSYVNPGINPVIKCVSLRVLELAWVYISEEVFDRLLSTCRLLEKVILCGLVGLKTIKVKNLGCLRRLEITSLEEDCCLEIDKVPSLRLFCHKWVYDQDKPLPFETAGATAASLGSSVTQLQLENIIIDDTLLDMIESKFPFLESLKLQSGGYWASERLVITSHSLKRLTLHLAWGHRLIIELQVYAPSLLSFDYDGETLPTLLFPTIAPKRIKLTLNLRNPLEISIFNKLREVLNLSSTFDIHIKLSSSYESSVPLDIGDVEDLRRRWVSLSFAKNVQQLSLTAGLKNCLWLDTRFFDALFSICHPVHLKAQLNDNNKYFSKLMVRWMMKSKTTDLKDVLLKNSLSGRWEPLTSSWECDVLDKLAGTYDVEFKLDWFSAE